MDPLTIDFEPAQIEPGRKVRLTASVPVEGTPYTYDFRIYEAGAPQKIVHQQTSNRPTIVWDIPKNFPPGPYEMQVTATPPPAEKPTATSKTLGERADVTARLYVHERTLTLTDVKQNVDDQFQHLAKEVGNVASAVGSVAGKLPDPGQPIGVSLQPQGEILTDTLKDLSAFFGGIRSRTAAISFNRYNEFVNRLLCEGIEDGEASCGSPLETGLSDYGAPSIRERRDDLRSRPSIFGVDAYQLLKLATEAFLVFETGVVVKAPRDGRTGLYGYRDSGNFVPALPTSEVREEAGRPGSPVTFQQITTRLDQYLSRGSSTGTTYLRRIVDALLGLDPARREEKLPYCDGILRHRLSCPSLIELIWSYWHEEGMLVQALNVIALRFQNRRGARDQDPLAHLEIDPLRPLNNLLWGYVQDEMHRLTVPRRAYEYDHHYGLTILGKAVPSIRPADSRSNFLEAFHNLLYRTAAFYHEDADTTVVADAFPLLNALREVHRKLAEGAHNQFGDLPWTARAEMLIQQWLLSRPEMREFLRGRAMVPYAEPWMGQVDTLKRLQSWSEMSVTDFHELAVFGEQILLSIRYHDWSEVNDQEEAKVFARYWKPEIQRYIHAYRAVTGVDLTIEPVDAMAPSVHLRGRLVEEQKRRAGRQ